MTCYCFLDLLPVELLFHLFTYFWTHEILLSFLNVSDHVDAILTNYSTYQVNFKAILKSHFDLVCKYIRPDQIISLIISDETDTSGQSELFFSHFRIEQFTQLQCLTLIEPEIDTLSFIFPNLINLHRLRH